MAEAVYFNRRKAAEREQGFDSLRREAVELIEKFSGQIWTDYNLHDPGITILEQLIYALTDLGYRCDFALEDYLADEDGKVNLEAQALHPGAEIFPCRPATPADYRKLLLNALPKADNIWISEMTGADSVGGLYQVSVKLASDVDADEVETIKHEIRRIYHGARNLCEDLGKVRVVENVEYQLCAKIEVGSDRLPTDILADIYFDCARCIASSATITNYDQVDERVTPLDQLFDGPYTDRGFFKDEDNRSQQSEFPVSALFAIINNVKGVDQIQQLYLSRDGKNFFDRVDAIDADHAFDLAIPTSEAKIKVELTTDGRVLPRPIDNFTARYAEIKFKYYASRSTEQKLSLLYQPIRGNVRPIDQYFSLQNQFPINYGINRFGVPESASTEVKAKVRQLKAYLVIFEQYLLNFLGNLDSVDVLFSPQTEPRNSYATQTLDPQQVADLDAVYPAEAESEFCRITAKFDKFDERKSRLLDYLLALYGERFSQYSLRHFNYYYSKDEIDAVIVANKVAFLNSIVELGRDRAAAPDYRSDSVDRSSGLEQRAAMLLGFKQPVTRSLTAILKDQDIDLCSHQEYQQSNADTDGLRLIEARDLDAERYLQPEKIVIHADIPLRRIRGELADITPLREGLLSEALLRDGIDMTRYRVGRDDDADAYRLCFELDTDNFWVLASYSDMRAATRAANYLRRFLLLLNRRSEGLHIVEHILLRPQQTTLSTSDEDLYSFRVSAVLPCWTKRCHDLDFKNLVRETLRLNAPAHVFIEFYWLEYRQMIDFERRYEQWLALKREPQADVAELDRHARALIVFLVTARETQPAEVWLPA